MRVLTEGARRRWILVFLLAPLVALHLRFAPRQGPFNYDPSYYMNAARFVADENRLLTSVSLYHHALVPLPQPYTLYPLWPLLLGIAAKAIGLIAAANALPQVFFVLDLVLFYVLANRIDGRSFLLLGEPVDGGHLAVLVAGLNFLFFESTLTPYTEGLAVALAIASLLMLDRGRHAAAGALAGLSVLARYQFVALPLATALVLLLRRRRALIPYCLLAAVMIAPWALYVRGREQRADVPRYDEWIHAPSLSGEVMQMAKGLGVAVNPFSRAALFHSFGPAVLLVPLAVAAAWRRMNLVALASLLTGLSAMAMLAHYEHLRPPHWLFGERHALLFVFAVIPALVLSVSSPRRAVGAVALLFAGIAVAQGAVAAFRYPLPAGEGLTPEERQMVGHLPSNACVLTTNAQMLSVYSRASFHWHDCDLDAAALIARTPIDRVIVYDRDSRCRFAQGLADVEATYGEGLRRVTVFRVRR